MMHMRMIGKVFWINARREILHPKVCPDQALVMLVKVRAAN